MATAKTKKTVMAMGSGYGGRLAGDLDFSVLRMDWDRHISVLIRHYSPGRIGERSVAVARNITFERLSSEEIDSGRIEVDPTLKLSYEEGQQLLDQLWNVGLRPSREVGGGKGELASTQRHLDDMRTIAANALDINLSVAKDGRQ